MVSLILQQLNVRTQCAPAHSQEKDDKIVGIMKNNELQKRLSSHDYTKFHYPEEETTHGVGYGVNKLHSNNLLKK